MLHRIKSRFGRAGLEALLEGDVLFFRSEDDDDGAGGSGGGSGSSQEDDDDAGDDDDDGAGSGDDDGSGDSDDDNDEADARVRKANRQAAKLRIELKEANKKLADADSAKLSEKEKAERERDEARQRADAAEARVKTAEREKVVVKVATKLGFNDVDAVLAMVETGRVPDIDADEDLDEADLKAALKKLGEKKPHLLNESSNGDGPNGRGNGTNPRKRDRTDEAIDKLPVQQRAHARLMSAFSTKK